MEDEKQTFGAVPPDALPAKSESAAPRWLAMGYVRVASVSQTRPRSAIDAQVSQIRVIAEAAGMELSALIEDVGESALNLKRSGLQKVLDAAAGASIQAVIVKDLERLARNPDHLRKILDWLTSRGVFVIFGAADSGCYFF